MTVEYRTVPTTAALTAVGWAAGTADPVAAALAAAALLWAARHVAVVTTTRLRSPTVTVPWDTVDTLHVHARTRSASAADPRGRRTPLPVPATDRVLQRVPTHVDVAWYVDVTDGRDFHRPADGPERSTRPDLLRLLPAVTAAALLWHLTG